MASTIVVNDAAPRTGVRSSKPIIGVPQIGCITLLRKARGAHAGLDNGDGLQDVLHRDGLTRSRSSLHQVSIGGATKGCCRARKDFLQLLRAVDADHDTVDFGMRQREAQTQPAAGYSACSASQRSHCVPQPLPAIERVRAASRRPSAAGLAGTPSEHEPRVPASMQPRQPAGAGESAVNDIERRLDQIELHARRRGRRAPRVRRWRRRSCRTIALLL